MDHIDGNKNNDKPSNLRRMSRAEHNRHHKAVHPTTKKCAVCGTTFTPPPTHRARAQVCGKASCRKQILTTRAKLREAGKKR